MRNNHKDVSDENHPRWNHNREEVLITRKIRRFMYRSLNRLVCDKAGKHTEEIHGYTHKDLLKCLESKLLPRMSWQNYGEWHIDHVKPISAFVKEGITDPKIINALDNLQPLWAEDNLKKSNKIKRFLV